MNEITIAQDNRLTTARYELSLIEKRVFYFIIKEVRKNYITAQRDLFDDLVLTFPVVKLMQGTNLEDRETEARKGLKALRIRSFEHYNVDLDKWLDVGYINYSEITKGVAEVQVSKKLMPFLVELSGHFTEYSLSVAMSLKSKWSQRMYELCQKWSGTDGFRISVVELRKTFALEKSYVKYAKFKENVLETPKRELKNLYDIGQSDVYFEYTEEKNGRSVEMLRFKLFRKNSMNVKTTHDMLLELIPIFQKLFDTSKKSKNDVFIKEVLLKLQRHPDLIEHLHKRVNEILNKNGEGNDAVILIRYILNEDVVAYAEKSAETKKASKTEEKQPSKPNDAMAEILGLANDKKV